MKGLTAASLRSHPSLIPLFVCVGAGAAGAAFYVGRLATRNLDVKWNKSKADYPWNQTGPSYQYKFYSPKRDYSREKFPDERPDV